jgi:uroporphyrinogen decarboxylase
VRPMTSRERGLALFARDIPDRVPRGYSANPGVHARVSEALGIRMDDHEALRQAFRLDFGGTNAFYDGPEIHEQIPDRHVDIWGVHSRWIEHGSGKYLDFCDFPLSDATEDEIAAWPMPNPDHFNYSRIADDCRSQREYCLSAGGAGTACIINRTAKLRGMEQILVDLMTDDPAGLLLIRRKQEIELEITRRTLEAGQGEIDFLWLGEDLGTQIGQMISLELYRKHLRPSHQQFVDLAKSFDLPVMIHTCGSSSWVYEDFIEMGIDAVDTLQPEAVNMSPEYLKTHFDGRLSFHGCIPTGGVMADGTPEEVHRVVRDTLDTMMPRGGYALAPAHMLQDNTPTENVLAIYQAADKYGNY